MNNSKEIREMEAHYRPCACRCSTPFFSERLQNIEIGHETDQSGSMYRTLYQHDRDKILYSHSFRRLRLKTQIFPEHVADHLRTRLDHTLEVAQIARHLARQLKLNEDLVDAIALAHDIGHTPFAHSGERALHKYLINLNLIGFKHNWQGLRVVDFIEKAYSNIDGLNLTNAVRIGILTHSERFYKQFPNEKCDCDMLEIINKSFDPESLTKDIFEVQIVRIADDIAGAIHDLEDALLSKVYSFSDLISKKIDSELLKKCIENLEDKGLDFSTFDLSKNENTSFLLSKIRSELIFNLTLDIINKSKPEIEKWERNEIKSEENLFNNFIENKKEFPSIIKLDKFFVSFDLFKKAITNNVIKSERVNRMDGKADYIIRHILDLYRTSPKQVPDVVIEMYNNFTNLPRNTNIRNWKEKRLIDLKNDKYFIRSIVDYVAGMTDRYALREYDLLFSAYPRASL